MLATSYLQRPNYTSFSWVPVQFLTSQIANVAHTTSFYFSKPMNLVLFINWNMDRALYQIKKIKAGLHVCNVFFAFTFEFLIYIWFHTWPSLWSAAAQCTDMVKLKLVFFASSAAIWLCWPKNNPRNLVNLSGREKINLRLMYHNVWAADRFLQNTSVIRLY